MKNYACTYQCHSVGAYLPTEDAQSLPAVLSRQRLDRMTAVQLQAQIRLSLLERQFSHPVNIQVSLHHCLPLMLGRRGQLLEHNIDLPPKRMVLDHPPPIPGTASARRNGRRGNKVSEKHRQRGQSRGPRKRFAKVLLKLCRKEVKEAKSLVVTFPHYETRMSVKSKSKSFGGI